MIEAEIRQLEADLAGVSADVVRLKSLRRRESIPQQELDHQVVREQRTQEEINGARALLTKLKTGYDMNLLLARARLRTAQAAALTMPDTVLMDARSKGVFGVRETGLVTELAGQQVRIVGTFRLGTDFANEGNVLMSEETFLKVFSTPDTVDSQRGKVELGIAR